MVRCDDIILYGLCLLQMTNGTPRNSLTNYKRQFLVHRRQAIQFTRFGKLHSMPCNFRWL